MIDSITDRRGNKCVRLSIFAAISRENAWPRGELFDAVIKVDEVNTRFFHGEGNGKKILQKHSTSESYNIRDENSS